MADAQAEQASRAGLAARAAALAILSSVMEDGQTMAQVLANPNGPLKSVGAQDRARAQRRDGRAKQGRRPQDLTP